MNAKWEGNEGCYLVLEIGNAEVGAYCEYIMFLQREGRYLR
jgi:hypothetical protein